MQMQEFNSEIGTLRRTYGEKTYNEERTLAMWRTLQIVEYDVFKSAINEIIQKEKTAPMLDTIRNYIQLENERIISKRRENIDQVLNKLPPCSYCSSQGFFHAENIYSKSAYLFSCDKCERAKILMGNYKDRPMYYFTRKYATQYKIEKPSIRKAWDDLYSVKEPELGWR